MQVRIHATSRRKTLRLVQFSVHNKHLLDQLHRTMIVAVVSVGMVQVPFHKIVDMIAMRHGFMTAVRPVMMILGMRPAIMGRGAGGRVRLIDVQGVFFHFPTGCWVVQMAIVEIIHMIAMLYGGVTATVAMLVVVVFVGVAHRSFS
jgi:hypothetical protein